MVLKFIDISSHQSVAQAGMAGIDGVIVKATQGTGYVNPRADQQYQTAKKKGRLLGFYHYAAGGDPVAEANYFYNNTKNYFGEAVPAVDWESMQNAAWGNTTWVRKFVDRIHALTGVWPLIYVQQSAISQVSNCAKDCGLWVAGYPSGGPTDWPAPKFIYAITPWKSYTLWQFTSANGLLDKNVAAVDKTGWGKIANPSGGTVAKPTPKPSKPAGYSTSGKSIVTMAYDVIAGKVGTGQTRISKLGKYYTAVQAVVNDKLKSSSRALTNSILAAEVKKGILGNGNARKNLLGSYYGGVQAVINGGAATIKKGSKVTVAKAVDYTGTPLAVSGTYTVMQLTGNRAVIGRGGVVTAAINKANLKLA